MGELTEGARLSLAAARRFYLESQPKKPKALAQDLQRDLRAGWLLRYLWPLDAMLWGRWEYWADLQAGCALPEAPIPPLDFSDSVGDAEPGRQMLVRCLNAVAGEHLSGDGWMGWSSFRYFDYLLDWLLFGFGHPGYEELPPEETNGASMRLYQLFDLSPLLLWPHDHLGDMLAECQHGKRSGFYPTPHSVCELMTQMVMGEGNHRAATVCDPALGSGRMLLHAAHHSLRLYGQDIDLTLCKTSLVNGYLFAPWLPRPIWWLDGATLRLGDALRQEAIRAMNDPGQAGSDTAPRQATPVIETPLAETPVTEMPATTAAAQLADHSDAMTAVAPPHYQARLFDTEFDAEGTAKTAPILKRRKRAGNPETAAAQLSLMEV